MQTPSDGIVIAAVAASTGTSTAVDLWTRRVPNELTLGIAAVGIWLAAQELSPVTLAGAMAGFALGMLLMLPGYLVGATGAGDVKLFAAVGTLLGPTRTGVAFLYTALAGGLLALVTAACRGRLGEALDRTATFLRTGGGNVADIERSSTDNRFAYAPAIAVGALAAALGL